MMREREHRLSICLTLLLLGLALACGGEDAPRSSGTPMAAPAPAEDPDENSAPVVESLALNPSTPLPGSALVAHAEVREPDGDAYRMNFEWRINGELVSSGPHPSITLQGVRKNDQIEVTAVATDGRLESEPVTESAQVANRPPLLQVVYLQPEGMVRPGDELMASPEAIDADDDSLEFHYVWLVNGSETGQTDRSFSTRGLKRGDKVRVRVVADDGTDESRGGESREITMGNSPPLIRSIPDVQRDDGVFRYTFEAEDPDGDRNLRFRLTKSPEGMTIDPILGVATWRPGPGQVGVHPVQVEVVDSQGDGSALQFELTVTANPGEEASQPPAATP